VVLIQDVHMNPEAQTNIAAVLQQLIDERQLGAVGVEGAFQKFDFGPFRSFQDPHIAKDVAADFLAKGLLAAPSFVGISSPVDPPAFVGVDDKTSYDANVRAYLATRTSKDKTAAELDTIDRDLERSKPAIFPAK